MNEDEIVIALLHAKMSVEEISPLIPPASIFLLIKEVCSSCRNILRIKNMWKQLPPLAINIIIHLKLGNSELIIFILSRFND